MENKMKKIEDALWRLALNKPEEGDLELIQKEENKEFDISLVEKAVSGANYLHLVIKNDFLEIFLKMNGSEELINGRNNNGFTPLDYTYLLHLQKSRKLIFYHGALFSQKNKINDSNKTPSERGYTKNKPRTHAFDFCIMEYMLQLLKNNKLKCYCKNPETIQKAKKEIAEEKQKIKQFFDKNKTKKPSDRCPDKGKSLSQVVHELLVEEKEKQSNEAPETKRLLTDEELAFFRGEVFAKTLAEFSSGKEAKQKSVHQGQAEPPTTPPRSLNLEIAQPPSTPLTPPRSTPKKSKKRQAQAPLSPPSTPPTSEETKKTLSKETKESPSKKEKKQELSIIIPKGGLDIDGTSPILLTGQNPDSSKTSDTPNASLVENKDGTLVMVKQTRSPSRSKQQPRRSVSHTKEQTRRSVSHSKFQENTDKPIHSHPAEKSKRYEKRSGSEDSLPSVLPKSLPLPLPTPPLVVSPKPTGSIQGRALREPLLRRYRQTETSTVRQRRSFKKQLTSETEKTQLIPKPTWLQLIPKPRWLQRFIQ